MQTAKHWRIAAHSGGGGGGGRLQLAAVSAALSLLDPRRRGDMVALFAETTAQAALRSLRERMKKDERGLLLLQQRRIVNSTAVDMRQLKLLGRNTFGRQYVEYMEEQKISTDSRSPVNCLAYNDDYAYIMLRYRQVHDLWHVLTGLPVTLLGEAALKWFEYYHTKLPMCLLSASAATLSPSVFNSLEPNEFRFLHTSYRRWAQQSALSSDFLLAIPYEDYFTTDIDSFRAQIGITLPPQLPPHDDNSSNNSYDSNYSNDIIT